jgi:two-component system LytT family sensor kinase
MCFSNKMIKVAKKYINRNLLLVNKINEIKPNIKTQHHFWFWLVYFLLNFLRWGAYFNDYTYSLKSNIVEFGLDIPLAYFNLFILIPRYVMTSKYYKYILSILISLILFYLLRTGLIYYIVSKDIWPEANREYKPFEINHIISVCIGELYVLAMVSSIYLTLIWLAERERNRALKENQFKMELKYLKSQIQPHFFFNTLNNLYALSLESSNKVSDVILKLSKLMEYVLYDVKGIKFATLIKEIDYIQNYIEIEKLRFENVEVTINLESNIDDVKVPPLLLISLIENAFKHGGANNKNLKIRINFKIINDSILQFEILNNFVLSHNLKTKKGIGLMNTKKRLKLIFLNNFKLEQQVKFNYYIIRLQIPIS